jgi:hypothetical protein
MEIPKGKGKENENPITHYNCCKESFFFFFFFTGSSKSTIHKSNQGKEMRRIITTVAKPASSKISSKSTQKGIPRNGGRRLRSRRRMRMREKKMNPVRTKQRQETAFLGFARSGAILGFRVCSFRNQLRFRVFRFLANARQSLKAHQHHHHHQQHRELDAKYSL